MKLKLLILTGTLAIASFHCSDCGDDVLPYFDAKGISRTEIFSVSSATKLSSYNGNRVIADNNLLGISFFFDASYYARTKNKEFSFSLISSAVACDAAPYGYDGSKERFDSITISSTETIDAVHPVGSSLNDLFEIRNKENDFVPLTEFAKDNPRLFKPEYDLILTTRPQAGKSHTFKVKVVLTNGEVYEKLTDPVVFQ